MSIQVTPIPAFKDNYIWLITNQRNRHCAVVDPGDAKPVIQTLMDKGLTLSAIFITHHHWDHTGGVQELVSRYQVPVYGTGSDGVAEVDNPLAAGETVTLENLDLRLTSMDIPGHTLGHIALYGNGMVFCGDTLFLAGCGRLFEGTPQQMYQSLNKLGGLPEETLVYCAHEYTLNNLAFAQAVEPNNAAIKERIHFVTSQRNAHQASIPAPLSVEKQTNPFLRCKAPDVIEAAEQYARKPLGTAVEIFATLRSWKDVFID